MSSGTRYRMTHLLTVRYGTRDGWETDGRSQRTYPLTFQDTRVRQIRRTGRSTRTFLSIGSIRRASTWCGRGPTWPILRAGTVRQTAPRQCSPNQRMEGALGLAIRNWFYRTGNRTPDPQSLKTPLACCTLLGMQPTRRSKGMPRSNTPTPETTERLGHQRPSRSMRPMG